MARKDPTATLTKWKDNLGAAGPAYIAGIQAVTTPPGQQAAAAADVWIANTQAAKALFVAKTSAVPIDYWKSQSTGVGATRLVDGATKGATKMGNFLNKYLPWVYGMVGSLPARGTYAANKQRMNAAVDALHAAKGSF